MVTRSLRALGAATAALLVLVAAAPAADGDAPVRLTKAGQAAAQAVVLKLADVGSATDWSKVPTAPNTTWGATTCGSFQPRESDLVLNGRAQAIYGAPGVQLGSQADVLGTRAMSRLYWQRFVLSPRQLGCLSQSILKGAVATTKAGAPRPRMTSATRIAFPSVGAPTVAYRVVITVGTGKSAVKGFVDSIFIWRGRTQLFLTVTAPLASSTVMKPAEAQLARVLVGRMRL